MYCSRRPHYARGPSINVLVLLNENPPGSHPDVYEAFADLVADGLIDRFDAYPFPWRKAQGASDRQIAGEILALLREGGHDLIVWMHTRTLGVSGATLDEIEGLPQRPQMVYWEGDSYHPFYKPVPRQMQAIMGRCRTVYMPCGGPVVRTLRRAGVRDLRYAPSCTSGTRFPPIWQPRGERTHEIVMIGNRATTRRPFKRMPGARQREALVRSLERRYGERFAVCGAGWSGPSAVGTCTFDEQADIYAQAAIAVGVNNSTYPLVFSNRVPIAMACGIPLVYSMNPRFADVFPDTVLATFFSSPEEALARIDALLESEASALEGLSSANRAFFTENLTTTIVARYIVDRARYGETGEASGRRSPVADSLAAVPPAWQRIPPL